ncbi:hypothetical protein B0H16DRAFT_1431558 [Mycena metata]|uniref:Peptidase S33 tripeptidyl aminopeptidase-like C-terminal domain-containing protein n=1 Tax=Mycena metata TaxID=1033252 RepID=A0AAD7HJ91_9AGAR|nr:hypothetical protein B0H16DRAFT_1431558 [Mycena metata]
MVTDFDTFSAHTVLEQGFTVASSTNLTNPAIEELVEQSRQFLALKQSQAELCGKNMGDELKYMGTATVVRDLDFMSKIFDGEDAKINYWGASYGSILGSYLVNMLPDRVGYVVIDGIVDPVVWSSEPSQNWPINWLQSTEKTYQFYLKTCSQAGPATCPLAKSANEPSGNILARLETLFDALALAPLPVPFGSRPGFLTSGAARALLLEYLEDPTLWGESALAFSQAMAANGTLLFNKLAAPYPGSISTPHYDLVRLGVTCLDSPPPASPSDVPTAEDLAAQLVKTLKEVSPHFGASTSVSEPDGGCQFWPVKGPERFTGPFTANLERPMLVISNTLDPITPIYSGLHVHTLMPNSTVLVIQDGPGHTSTAILTPCTLGLVQGYFAGILPDNGTVCNVTYPYFSDESGPAAASSALIELPGLEKDAPALIALLRGL